MNDPDDGRDAEVRKKIDKLRRYAKMHSPPRSERSRASPERWQRIGRSKNERGG
jgi:hypothetical protein